jgi:serine/threonine protein kinase
VIERTSQSTEPQASPGAADPPGETEIAATYLRDGPPRNDPPRSALGTGSRLVNGKFELQQILGEGGMGAVFRAIDLEAAQLRDPNPYLAIKVLHESIKKLPQAKIALQRECSRARRLAHPNIIRVYEFYEDPGRDACFITMELLQGQSWASMMRESPQGMTLKEARPLILQLCSALTYAHTQPDEAVVHSDLKPQNLFLTHDNVVKILDFGIAARVRRETADPHKTFFDARELGALSPSHASLEMWQKMPADPRDDIYSLGCIVYELLSGTHPFKGATAMEAFTYKLVPADIPNLSRAQNRALRHALQLPRPQRTASVAEFVREFFEAGSRIPPLPRPRIGATLAVIAVIGAAGIWFATRKHSATPGAIPGKAAVGLAQFLGATAAFDPDRPYSRDQVLSAIASAPRRVQLGSTDSEIDAAVALCLKFSTDCPRGAYADEHYRQVTLPPFALERTAVTVRAFRSFVAATHYKTDAERSHEAYSLSGGLLRRVAGGSWRNAVGTDTPREDSAVVGVSFHDAQEYCRWGGMRLPTEDEWEYAARGPQRYQFPWGNELAPASGPTSSRPAAADGPAEGIGGVYRGLSGNVWEWVDTQGQGGADRRVLKGGSWLTPNPADRRAAARLSERSTMADSDSGFRCVRPLDRWPDSDFWVRNRL